MEMTVGDALSTSMTTYYRVAASSHAYNAKAAVNQNTSNWSDTVHAVHLREDSVKKKHSHLNSNNFFLPESFDA